MATDNKSPSYLAEREAVRTWLQRTKDGQYARKQLMDAMGGDASSVLDDDQHVDWEEIVKEYRGSTVFAANCREAREAFELARQASSTLGPPGIKGDRMMHYASVPVGYALRRQIETADPEYWSSPANVYREVLAHPQWATVPLDIIRGELESILPKGERSSGPTLWVKNAPEPERETNIILTDATG